MADARGPTTGTATPQEPTVAPSFWQRMFAALQYPNYRLSRLRRVCQRPAVVAVHALRRRDRRPLRAAHAAPDHPGHDDGPGAAARRADLCAAGATVADRLTGPGARHRQ